MTPTVLTRSAAAGGVPGLILVATTCYRVRHRGRRPRVGLPQVRRVIDITSHRPAPLADKACALAPIWTLCDR